MKKWMIPLFLLGLMVVLAACGGKGDNAAQETPSQPSLATPVQGGDDALKQQEEAVDKNPSAAGYLELGNAYAERGRFNDAVRAYKKGLGINPNDPAILANLGVALYQMGRFDEAREQFQKALKVKPDDAATTYLLGAAYLQMGDQENAEAMFKKALEIDPQLPEAHFGLGTLYMLQGKKDLAIQEFETFLAGPPAQDPRAKTEAERYLQQLKGQ